MKDYTKEIGVFLEKYIKTHSISFFREDPHAFASRVSTAFSSFFLETTEECFIKGLKEKALYSLWNTCLDDIIEYTDKGKKNIFDSLESLIVSRKGENFKGETISGRIMYDFIQQFYGLPSGPNKKISEELMFLDLFRILNGFDYERIANENDPMGTLSEYMEFGIVTTDVRVFLDIDIALYPYQMDFSTIGELREAYRWFDMAIRLSGDIATLEREFFEETSQNAVILYGRKKGMLPKDILKVERTQKEELLEKIIPSLVIEIEKKGKEYLIKSMKCLEKIDMLETRHISAFFEKTFKAYPWHKDFSPPSTT